MKLTQKQRVIEELQREGRVTRNWALQQYITRLAALIDILESEGWEFETEHTGRDYVYKIKHKQLTLI